MAGRVARRVFLRLLKRHDALVDVVPRDAQPTIDTLVQGPDEGLLIQRHLGGGLAVLAEGLSQPDLEKGLG